VDFNDSEEGRLFADERIVSEGAAFYEFGCNCSESAMIEECD
jgi:hypothetical protein